MPESGDFGVGVSILSDARGLQFGPITHAKMWPDRRAILERLREFEKPLWRALMARWPGDEGLLRSSA